MQGLPKQTLLTDILCNNSFIDIFLVKMTKSLNDKIMISLFIFLSAMSFQSYIKLN